jgi:hypothetical protein
LVERARGELRGLIHLDTSESFIVFGFAQLFEPHRGELKDFQIGLWLFASDGD